ncbi:hypothetical protein DFH09DRAFT_276567 [Mycena vulgaris]|nr:hypothetical protein DFH09DRAFT_276567 [Mycena vulgaris]
MPPGTRTRSLTDTDTASVCPAHSSSSACTPRRTRIRTTAGLRVLCIRICTRGAAFLPGPAGWRDTEVGVCARGTRTGGKTPAAAHGGTHGGGEIRTCKVNARAESKVRTPRGTSAKRDGGMRCHAGVTSRRVVGQVRDVGARGDAREGMRGGSGAQTWQDTTSKVMKGRSGRGEGVSYVSIAIPGLQPIFTPAGRPSWLRCTPLIYPALQSTSPAIVFE